MIERDCASSGSPLAEARLQNLQPPLHRATFAAVTNGTQLDAFEHLLGPGKIDNLQITLDGSQYARDRRRINADGSGSFEAIATNVTMALEL
jgi:uncharacterized protein